MLLITAVVIYTFSNTLLPWLRALSDPFGWPDLVTSLVSVVSMVTLMTYWVMPLVTNALSGWLHKNN